MTVSKQHLAELVKAGVLTDIFKAERAYEVLKTIGENAEAINTSESNFGELLGTLQGHAQTEALISIARLYDRPSTRYPTRCLQSLLDELEAKAELLPPIVERYNLASELSRLGMCSERAALLGPAPDADVTRAMVAFIRERLVQPSVLESIERVKTFRDKFIAHNEAAHSIEGPTWSAVLQLLALAQELVGIVGWAYLSTVYIHEGQYLPSSDAKRAGLAMRRMLEGLGIIESRFPRRTQPPIVE